MTARARLLRIMSTVLAAALLLGGGSAAVAVELDDPAATQALETIQAPASDPVNEVEGEASAVSEDEAKQSVAVDSEPTEQPSAEAEEPGSGNATAEVPAEETAPTGDTETAAAPEADAESVTTTVASLEWGVRASFRNYIYNTQPKLFQGRSTILGAAIQPIPQGTFFWQDGNGTAAADGSSGDISFGDNDGVHFQSHPMDVAGQKLYSLDLQFSQPRVVITSATTGELRMDVVGREFIDTVSVGPEYSLNDVLLATLELPTPVISDGVLTWTDADATLTATGSDAFGGYYAAGEKLDPLTFSTAKMDIPAAPQAQVTTTALSVSPATVTVGAEATLAATVTPASAAGELQFKNGSSNIGGPVPVAKGEAKTSVKLPVGSHRLTAEFTPADPGLFAASVSEAKTLTVTAKQPPKAKEGKVAGATLDWGVKESFRNYIYNFKAFKGKSALLGNTKQPIEKGSFRWSSGSGTAMDNGSKADVSFGSGNGAHFQSHPMGADFALDLQFTNPRIVIKSATTGELRMDVVGREFIDMNTKGNKFQLKNTVMATLTLPEPTAKGKTLTWTNAAAKLTQSGETAFGGFYSAGDLLDPLTFSFPLDTEVTVKSPTKTTLAASAKKVELGSAVTLTAAVSPSIAGTVAFSYGNTQIGKPVAVKAGKAATRTTALPVGIHSITAVFTPAGDTYGRSISSPAKVTVTQKQPKGEPQGKAPQTGQAAGSLNWAISSAFIAYTTCANKEAYGYSHCAKGDIVTNGVGAGYLFPQATGGSWDKASQTGTVNYSGTVTFKGYGMTMFEVVNPSITVTGPTSATLNTGNASSFGAASYGLNLGSANKQIGPNGEVTWSGVSVQGSLDSGGAGGSGSQSIGLDALTFTVGTASGVNYGTTQQGDGAKEKRIAAASAPATSGINVLTDASKIKPGGRIELEASGFEAEDEGVLVVLYGAAGSEPIVLDEEAKADKSGAVTWSGTLPKDVKGKHTITLQGSVDAGAAIDILDLKTAKKKAAEKLAQADPQAVQAAGIGGSISSTGGMSTWEWWASAGGLVAIAACMTLLAIRQRRLSQ